MRVIDLLNKIAKEEDVPKKIRYDDEIYYLDHMGLDYYALDFEVEGQENMESKLLLEAIDDTNQLNEEIEIIEPQEHKIPEKLYHCCMETNNEEIKFLIKNINDMLDKINEIIDYLGDEE